MDTTPWRKQLGRGMKKIGACFNCSDEFVCLLDNGLCEPCQSMYERRRVTMKLRRVKRMPTERKKELAYDITRCVPVEMECKSKETCARYVCKPSNVTSQMDASIVLQDGGVTCDMYIDVHRP